jgi:Tol biopolymer transport system component
MKKITLVTIILFVGLGQLHVIGISSERQPEIMIIDNMLRINSVVGGRESPKWSPDGSQIIFPSSLYGGSLVSINPEGGFPIQLPIEFSQREN